MTLEIQDLHVDVDGVEIIKGVSLTFHRSKVHALMGPNGSGKSTLVHAIMGHPKYKITRGKIILDGKDITNEKPHLRARAGLFLSFQYPAEVSGVTISNFLRTAYNATKEKSLSVLEFHQLLQEKMQSLKMDSSLSKRYLNHGFSGGEKKRAEVLQMMVLQPQFAFLDETDSGLDVDALKIVAEGINLTRDKNDMGIVIITHYNKFLRYVAPDEVSILYKGQIVERGGSELAQQIEERGFEGVINQADKAGKTGGHDHVH